MGGWMAKEAPAGCLGFWEDTLAECRWREEKAASLNGHPGDRVNLSCIGVSQPTRWVWAPRFPACKGLSKGRRPILWASPSGTPTVSPAQPFAGRINALDLGIRRLELLLSAGDSGTFICKGRQDEESRTELHVLGDRAYCKALGSSYSQILIPLLGTGLVLGLGVVGWACWRRRRSPPHPPRPTPRFVSLVKAEPQRPEEEEEPKMSGDLDQEPDGVIHSQSSAFTLTANNTQNSLQFPSLI
nr:protein G6b isoform X7 [Odocoileus virginianus texanus]